MSDYICNDLLLLILKWFAVKTLLQCRCVCKSWKNIIDSTPFILNHLAIQKPRIILQKHKFEYLILDSDNTPVYDILTGPDVIQTLDRVLGHHLCYLQTVSTVHGVICLYDNGDNIILWNPSIRRNMKVPLPEISSSAVSTCHKNREFKYCGFWIDPSNNDFKVVIFCFQQKGIALYSSKTKTWTEIAMEVNTDDFGQECESPQVLINGVAHWNCPNNYDCFGGFIFYFDFVEDEFGTIDLPIQLDDWGMNMNVSKWNNCLSIAGLNGYLYPYGIFDVWVMQNDGLWSKMIRCRLMEGIAEILCVLEEDDWVKVLASTNKGELVLSDNEDLGHIIPLRSRKNDEYLPMNFKYEDPRVFSYAYDFVESLVFPDPLCLSSSD